MTSKPLTVREKQEKLDHKHLTKTTWPGFHVDSWTLVSKDAAKIRRKATQLSLKEQED